jgi:hypothetical protein
LTARLEALVRAVPRALIACGLSYLVLLVSFVTLLALALWLPADARIESRLREAVQQGVITAEDRISPFGAVIPTDDECVALTLNLSNRDRSLLYRIAVSPWDGPQPTGAYCESCACLVNATAAGRVTPDYPYFRFWHGYQAYARPLLAIMPVGSLHWVNALMLCLAFTAFLYRFARSFGTLSIPVLVIPFVFAGDLLSVPFTLVHTLPLAWVFLSATLMLTMLERRDNQDVVILALTAFIAGSVLNFLSFLYNPPLAMGLIGLPVLAKSLTGLGVRQAAHAVARAAVAIAFWAAGYALTWIAKWGLAAAVLGGGSVVSNVLAAASGSSYHDSAAEANWVANMGFLDPTITIISRGPTTLGPMIAASWIIAGFVLAYGAVSRRLTRGDLVDFLALQLLLLVPVGWGWLFRSASIEHIGFVYRNYLPFVIFPLFAAAMLLRRGRRAGAEQTARVRRIF